MRIIAVAVLMAGCAGPSPRPEQSFAAPPDAVLAAVRETLHEYRDIEVAGWRIETSWGPERGMSLEQGPLLGNEYRVRVRYGVEIEPSPLGSRVRADATVERRAPGGVRSIRWERIASDGKFERELFDAIQVRIHGEKKP